MKKTLLLLNSILLCAGAIAQSTFSDDFESYTLTTPKLGLQSSVWRTWSSATGGGAEDVSVVNTDNHTAGGSKSIYFSSTSSTGGPQDVILPFGGVYSSGTFNFTAWFNVPSGKTAYFNFQADATPGVTWATECNMDGTGNIDFGDGNGTFLIGNYPTGVWFELKVNIDLTGNNWEVFVDGVTQGSWSNPVNMVASADIYPANPSAIFWVDDVSYTYTPDAVGIIESSSNSPVLSLYPNPVTSAFSIKGDHAAKGQIQVDLYQVNGVLAGNKVFDQPAGSFVLPFEMSAYAAGIYFVKITADGKSTMMKLVKE